MARPQLVSEAPCTAVSAFRSVGPRHAVAHSEMVPQAELLSGVGLCAHGLPGASFAEGWHPTTCCCGHFASSALGAVTVADGQGRGGQLLSSLLDQEQRPTAGTRCAAVCSAASRCSDLPLGAGAWLSSFGAGSAQSGPHSFPLVSAPREVGRSGRGRRLGRAASAFPCVRQVALPQRSGAPRGPHVGQRDLPVSLYLGKGCCRHLVPRRWLGADSGSRGKPRCPSFECSVVSGGELPRALWVL